MGYIQTSRAEQAIASLRAMSPSEATVLRDGQRTKVAAVELVPGDVMLCKIEGLADMSVRVVKA